MPDFKTIADFREDNGKAIRGVCRAFIVLCRDLKLFSEAIDGSKFKAVNHRDKNFTDRKLKARMQQLEDSIARYMTELDRADREPALVTEARVEHIKEKMQTVKKQMRELKQIGKQMSQAPDGQISLTDPDARSMATSGRGTGMVGYNVQTAVDTKHHLIVAHEVTNTGHDSDHLSSTAHQARDAVARQANEPSGASGRSNVASRYISIGRQPVHDVPLNPNARPAIIGASLGGNTRTYSKRCKGG